MKDEFGKLFRKKEFIETLIVVIITLFVVCIGFSIPDLFPFILLVIVVALIAILITSRQKKNWIISNKNGAPKNVNTANMIIK